ncbi:MAG: hypothetical protein ABFS14_11675 [Gemmatimonadota bacterium]
MRAAVRAQERKTPEIMRVDGVIGTAVGMGANGEPVVTVLTKTDRYGGLPARVDGIPVEVMVIGEVFALGRMPAAQEAKVAQEASIAQEVPRERGNRPVEPFAKPTCGVGQLPDCPPDPGGGDPPPPLNERHPRPVPIGVSTGHPTITAGTIGARVIRTDPTDNRLFAMSNNHVYAAINNFDLFGTAVIQPGSFDGGASPADDIGTLWAFVPINFAGCNVMDVAMAETTAADVGNSTPDGIGYGTPRSATMAAAPGMAVKKVGRTTGFTKGTVSAVNATLFVNYGTPGLACFVGQVVIGSGFSGGGDSGSLIVVDGKGRNRNNDRKPVGLLFAGSVSSTIANPIGPVLDVMQITIDGD